MRVGVGTNGCGRKKKQDVGKRGPSHMKVFESEKKKEHIHVVEYNVAKHFMSSSPTSATTTTTFGPEPSQLSSTATAAPHTLNISVDVLAIPPNHRVVIEPIIIPGTNSSPVTITRSIIIDPFDTVSKSPLAKDNFSISTYPHFNSHSEELGLNSVPHTGAVIIAIGLTIIGLSMGCKLMAKALKLIFSYLPCSM